MPEREERARVHRCRVAVRRAAAASGAVVVVFGVVLALGHGPGSKDRLAPVANGVMIAVLGLGLGLAARVRPRWPDRILSLASAAAAATIALLTLYRYGVGNLGDSDGHATIFAGSRPPSLPTATATLLLAIALPLRSAEDRRVTTAGDVAAFFGLSVSLIGLLGHLFEAPALYGAGPRSGHGMMPGSAAALLVVALGVFGSQPDRGAMRLMTADDLGGVAARRLVGGLLLLVPAAAAIAFGARAGAYSLGVAGALTIYTALALGGGLLLLVSAALGRLGVDLERGLHAGRAMSEAVALMPERGLDHVLETIARELCSASEASCAAVALHEQPGDLGRLVVVGAAHHEVRDEIVRLGLTARDTPYRLDDEGGHLLPTPEGGRACVRTWFAVPIGHQGRRRGTLIVGHEASTAFGARDRRMTEALALRAGTAVETAQLQESEARQRRRLEIMLDQMPEAVVVVDADGHATEVNRAARLLAGTAAIETARSGAFPIVLRTPDGAPLDPESSPAILALRTDEALTGVELLARGQEGREVPVLVSAAPIVLDGYPREAIVVLQDVTALKALERLREEWSAVIAHDLRQPVVAVTLTVGVLKRKVETGELAVDVIVPLLDRVADQARRLARMIGDLLDASRIEARRITIFRQRLDVAALVRDTLTLLRDVHPGADLRLDAPETSIAEVDGDRIAQVLGNLVSNAVKYGDPGRPIEVRIRGDDDEVEVEVENEGPTIPPERHRSLFERFARVPDVDRRGQRGIGLGLYVSKGLIEAHGGRITAESVDGRTRFRFTVPRVAPEP